MNGRIESHTISEITVDLSATDIAFFLFAVAAAVILLTRKGGG